MYSAPVLHGPAKLKLDAGIGPLRLGQKVDAVEHGTSGQLLVPTRVAYRLGDRGILLTEYGSDRRVKRIEPNIEVDVGNVNFRRWRHYVCRPGRLYRHSNGTRWTTVFVDRMRPKRAGRVIVGTGTAPRSCSAAGLAPLSRSG
jgi:hypothetical protein